MRERRPAVRRRYRMTGWTVPPRRPLPSACRARRFECVIFAAMASSQRQTANATAAPTAGRQPRSDLAEPGDQREQQQHQQHDQPAIADQRAQPPREAAARRSRWRLRVSVHRVLDARAAVIAPPFSCSSTQADPGLWIRAPTHRRPLRPNIRLAHEPRGRTACAWRRTAPPPADGSTHEMLHRHRAADAPCDHRPAAIGATARLARAAPGLRVHALLASIGRSADVNLAVGSDDRRRSAARPAACSSSWLVWIDLRAHAGRRAEARIGVQLVDPVAAAGGGVTRSTSACQRP